jgi:hypothetical protein
MRLKVGALVAGLIGLGVTAFGVQIKSNSLFIGVTGNYLNSRNFSVEGFGDRAFKGVGAQIGFLFYLSNTLNLGSRFLLSYAHYRDNVQPTGESERALLKIDKYGVAYDLIIGTGTLFHPYFGIGYNLYHFDWNNYASGDFSGPSVRAGALFYFGEHIEFEIGGSYIHIGDKRNLESSFVFPVWEGQAGFNFSF